MSVRATPEFGGRRPDRRTLLQRVCQELPPVLSARLFHSVLSRRPQRAGRPFTARTITTALYSNRTGDALADKVRMCGYWDWRNLAIAATFCGPGDQIIEIGANTGTETVSFAKIVPQGRVYAFEPEPSLLEVLRNNVNLNGFSNVVVFAAAVTDTTGSLFFNSSTVGVNSGIGHIAKATDDTRKSVKVSGLTIDSISDDLGPASLIAIDVEGHEILVLRGASRYLRRYRPVIVLEVCPMLLRRAGQDLPLLTAELKALDYEAFEIGKFGIHSVSTGSRTNPNYEANWLCLPRERSDAARSLRGMFVRCALTPNVAGLHPLAQRGTRSER